MVTTAASERTATRSRTRTAVALAAAVVIAIAANAVVATVAVASGAPATYGPLTLPAYGLFTALGVIAGWIGWTLVQRRARDPRRTLSILVPVVTVASFVPDVLLLALGFIPGTTTGAVIALMVMHLVVVAVAVPAYAYASRER
ncbi:DUF6069 family protein [Microbacterium sp. NPDC089695]|uniref:DUF6069 family protein n=1 Tax=Microbacterium sp. NPDC089695 TaxID=3364198 RepID=UPI0037FCEF92